MKADIFKNILPEDFKSSAGDGESFDGLFISVCDELCTIGISPSKLTPREGGDHLTPEQFHDALIKMHYQRKNGQDTEVISKIDAVLQIRKEYFDTLCCKIVSKIKFMF